MAIGLRRWTMLATLCCVAECAHAKGWDCKEPNTVFGVSSKVIAEIEKVRQEQTLESANQRMDELLKSAPSKYRVALYQERIGIAIKFKQVDQAARDYRALFDLKDASTPIRERARNDLSLLFFRQGKAAEIVALYSDTDRPACDATLNARYRLAAAYNTTGDYAAAEKMLSDVWEVARKSGVSESKLPNDWHLLRLRLDCNQERWTQCAADFDGLLRSPVRNAIQTKQLNVFLPRMRTIPQLADVLALAEKEGIIKGNVVSPSLVEEASTSAESATTTGELSAAARVPPMYPGSAVKNRQSGFVLMHVEVNEDGTVAKVRVIDSEPKGLFDPYAVAAVLKWRFMPVIVNGEFVRQSGTQKIQFNHSP